MTHNTVHIKVRKMLSNVRKDMHKKNKQWILVSLSVLAVAGGVGFATARSSIHADHADSPLPFAGSITNNSIEWNTQEDKSQLENNASNPVVSGTSGSGISYTSHHHLPFEGVFQRDVQGENLGAPNHYGYRIPDFGSTHEFSSSYSPQVWAQPYWDLRNIGKFHGGEDVQYLQDGSGSSDVMMASYGSQKPEIIKALYPKAAKVQGMSQPADVLIKITDIHDYHPWKGNHSIVFSRNLADGLQYNGIVGMNIQYVLINPSTGQPLSMKDSKGNPLTSYLEFDNVDALARYHYSRANSEDVETNNESRTDYIDGTRGIHPYGAQIFGANGAGDHTGEYVNPLGGKAYAGSHRTTEESYYSKILGEYIDGGAYGTYTSVNNRRNIILQMSGNNINVSAGSGLGYGAFKPMTKIKKSKIRLTKSTSQGNETQSGKKNVLHLRDDTSPYTYTITGQIPRSASHYWLYDHIPIQAHDPRVTRVSGVPKNLVNETGHNLHFDLNQDAADSAHRVSTYAGMPFTITIEATPDKDELIQRGQTFVNGVRVRQNGRRPINRYATDYAPLPKQPPKPPKPTTTPTPITKNASRHTIVHPGQYYTYSIKGQIPGDWHYYNDYVDPNTDASLGGVKTDVNDTGWQSGDAPMDAVRPDEGDAQTPNYGTSYYMYPSTEWTGGYNKDGSPQMTTVMETGSTQYIRSWNVYPYHLYNSHPDDKYDLSDYLPKDTSFVKFEKTDGLPVQVDDNGHITMDLNAGNEDNTQKHDFYSLWNHYPMDGTETDYGGNDAPDSLQRFAGKKYTIRVRVKADKLPNMNANNQSNASENTDPSAGYDDSNLPKHPDESGAPRSNSFEPTLSHKSGWYNWYNQATTDEQLYNKNDDETYHEHSNIVRNRIRVIEYHRYHYDFNHDQNGTGNSDVIPKQEMPGHDDHSIGKNDSPSINQTDVNDTDDGGNNDQYHKNYRRNDLLPDNSNGDVAKQAAPQLGYEGTQVNIPLIDTHNQYTDENGNTKHARYHFGYDMPGEDRVANRDVVHAILGGFDDTTHKHSGNVLGNAIRPDASDSSTFRQRGEESGTDNIDGHDVGDDQQTFSMNFYKPYYIPRQHTHNGDQSHNGGNDSGEVRFITDTDKSGNGLPFRLDLVNNDYMYGNDYSDMSDSDALMKELYQDCYMHLRIYKGNDDNGPLVYDKRIPYNQWINHVSTYGTHNDKKIEFRGILNTTDSHIPDGQSVPLHADLGFDEPNDGPQLDGFTTDSHAYIANRHKFNNGDFNHGQVARNIAPERTIKYGVGSSDDPRVQYEELMLQQNHRHDGTFVTGYGLRSDLEMTYYGILGHDDNGDDWANGDVSGYEQNRNDYRHQLSQSSIMDFAFPKSFDDDSGINYSSELPYGNDKTASHNGRLDTNHSANQVDRLQKVPHYHFSKFTDDNTPVDDRHQTLDTLYDSVNGTDGHTDAYQDASKAKRLDSLFDSQFHEHLMTGNYDTTYKFYPRAIERGTLGSSMAQENGESYIAHGSNDPLTKASEYNGSNPVISSLNRHQIHRLFTPYWLPLSTGVKDSINPVEPYNTVFEKARPSYSQSSGDEDTQKHNMTSNSERLGGNFFNIEDSRADEAVGHMMVADNAPHDGQRSSSQLESDQMHSGESIQPVLGGHKSNNNLSEDTSDDDSSNHIGQNVSGFSKIANGWVRFVHNWRNLL